MKLATNNQNIILFLGFILDDLVSGLFIIGKKYKMAMDMIRANTPPNLLGIDRKIAYIGRKYHSGWMWVGVTKGLAGIKFSGSISKFGFSRTTLPSKIHSRVTPIKSLAEK